jgi:hypothetical protein
MYEQIQPRVDKEQHDWRLWPWGVGTTPNAIKCRAWQRCSAPVCTLTLHSLDFRPLHLPEIIVPKKQHVMLYTHLVYVNFMSLSIHHWLVPNLFIGKWILTPDLQIFKFTEFIPLLL